MSLADEYKRQWAWRSWATVFDALPPLEGRTLLDLGCAVGDQAAALAARGARVIGVDADANLLGEARSRGIEGAEFRLADLRARHDFGVLADGIWCSFMAAYLPDLRTALGAWARYLRPGSWIALTEIDDLFGHEPLDAQARLLLEAYARDALEGRRYDFHMGRKLRGHLERSGFSVSKELTLEDREFSFHGPALPEVLDAWRSRFDRMTLLRDFCGSDFGAARDAFLACLASAEHRSLAKVCCCIATR